ncbi:hypothetical protein IIC38_00240 [candidate division KSB1 bacterium]|nr:hypothetical protein [candidate division KSB1 bacterium]
MKSNLEKQDLVVEDEIPGQIKNNQKHFLLFKEKMASLEQLAAGIAHELRNPLSIIGTSVYYLNKVLENHPEVRVHEHLTIMQVEIIRSQRIINNLLDFSQRTSTERESADVNKIIRQTLSLIEKNLLYQEIELESNLEHGPLCFINVSEIKQVLLNIFMNAMEAMPSGGCLTIHTYVKEKNYLAVDITDTGIGIEQEDLKKIFEPFFSSKLDQNGIGLGLSLVDASISRNHGEIHITSEIGKGTKVSIVLPISS